MARARQCGSGGGGPGSNLPRRQQPPRGWTRRGAVAAAGFCTGCGTRRRASGGDGEMMGSTSFSFFNFLFD